MNYNILQIRKYLGYYVVLWFFCAGMQWLVLYVHLGAHWHTALIDTLISTGLLFIFSLASWNVVRFTKTNSGIRITTFFNSMLAGFVLLALSFYASQLLLESRFLSSVGYSDLGEGLMRIKLGLGALMVIIINMYFINVHLISESRDFAAREVKLKTMVQQTELQALKNQLNPHFIYNSLNAISSLTTTEPEKAREMIIRLSEFLRYSLKTDAMQLNSLADEIKAINRYLEIEKVRFGDKLTYKFACEDRHLACLIPAMILQPLFENAIKHGIQKKIDGGEIVCTCSTSASELIILVSNPYDGNTAYMRKEGVGLENIRNRLRLMYGNGKLMHIYQENKIFYARLSLPLST